MKYFNHMYYPSQGRWAAGMAHRDRLIDSGRYVRTSRRTREVV